MKICVVGGGTAGFIAATILKRFLNADVSVIYSSKAGIVGVGEGSTEHFSEYMNFLGIRQYDLIKESDATFKLGILFDGWTKDSYMHHVGSPYSNKVAQYSNVYAHQIINDGTLVPDPLYNNRVDKWFLNREEYAFTNQYHFNTYKLNSYLHKLSESMTMKVIDDEIIDVKIKECGNIESVVGQKNTYNADIFIDATGFKKLLIGKMGARWKSFKDYLKMKSAVVFPTPENEEYNLYTTAKAMDYGWAFSLPVWGRNGNGYIFDSDYISMDQAKKEVIRVFGDVEFKKEFNFDAGYLENPWIKNCIAVGLSSSFVEPLEATSIGTSIQQSFLLMHKLANYSKKDIEQYNNSFTSIMENIRDFIFLHYMVKKNSTNFWKDVSRISPPDSLQEKLELWKNRLPIHEDFSGSSDYILFSDLNYSVVMHGLGMFNKQQISKDFYNHSLMVQKSAEDSVTNAITKERFSKTLGHKEMIELIRKIS